MAENGAPLGPQHQVHQAVSIEEIGSLIRQKRRAERLTLEQAARQSGVSAATLSRLERRGTAAAVGKELPTPDMRTINAILKWMKVALADGGFVAASNVTTPNVTASTSVPNIVEAHLRADRNLKPDTAGLLARMFRAAYAEFTIDSSDRLDESKHSGSDAAPGREDKS